MPVRIRGPMPPWHSTHRHAASRWPPSHARLFHALPRHRLASRLTPRRAASYTLRDEQTASPSGLHRRQAMSNRVDQAVKTAPMSTSDAGRKGGTAVRDKYGEDYYRRIGKLGGTTLKEKRGSDYYRDIAKKGGRANVDKYGPDHFAEMGKKGGNTTKQRQSPDFYSRIGKPGGAAKRRKKTPTP